MVNEAAERVRFALYLVLGRLLRAGRYSTVRIGARSDRHEVEKRRRFFAPFLIWMGAPLMRFLNTGVRVLPLADWHARERRLYRDVHGASIRVDDHGTLVLPRLRGVTLAALLEDPAAAGIDRQRAIELAVAELVRFHRLGFTHGDAMAGNVMVDVAAGSAHWFDFETVHDEDESPAWRRADDVRALLTTCLVRTAHAQRAATLRLILDAYADQDVTGVMRTFFTARVRRALVFHLGQASLSFDCYREIAHLLGERSVAQPAARATRRGPA